MPNTSTRNLIKALRKAGFKKIRTKGGHAQFYNSVSKVRVTVSVHLRDQKMNNVVNILNSIKKSNKIIEEMNNGNLTAMATG